MNDSNDSNDSNVSNESNGSNESYDSYETNVSNDYNGSNDSYDFNYDPIKLLYFPKVQCLWNKHNFKSESLKGKHESAI